MRVALGHQLLKLEWRNSLYILIQASFESIYRKRSRRKGEDSEMQSDELQPIAFDGGKTSAPFLSFLNSVFSHFYFDVLQK